MCSVQVLEYVCKYKGSGKKNHKKGNCGTTFMYSTHFVNYQLTCRFFIEYFKIVLFHRTQILKIQIEIIWGGVWVLFY